MKLLLLAPVLAVAACAARPVLPATGPYALKLETFTEDQRAMMATVLDEPTAMVELPETRVETRTQIFEHLLGDLVFTAGVLRAQGLAVYKVRFDDTRGICMVAQLLRREPGRHVFYSRGTYDLGLFTAFGSTLIIVVHEARDGAVWTQARVYAKVDGIVLEQGARFLGLVEGVIRRKAFVFIEAASTVAEMAAKEPDRMLRGARESPEVAPAALEEFRRKFVKE
jgi:hypothetical protein